MSHRGGELQHCVCGTACHACHTAASPLQPDYCQQHAQGCRSDLVHLVRCSVPP